MWRWRKRPRPGAGAGGAVPTEATADVAAFLLGGSAEYYQAQGVPVPPWAWLNAVAHASPEVVEGMCHQSPAPRGKDGLDAAGPRVGPWVAVALRERSAGNPARLRLLQRDRLVPLELALIAGKVHAPGPAAVARLALAALRASACPPAASHAPSTEELPP